MKEMKAGRARTEYLYLMIHARRSADVQMELVAAPANTVEHHSALTDPYRHS